MPQRGSGSRAGFKIVHLLHDISLIQAGDSRHTTRAAPVGTMATGTRQGEIPAARILRMGVFVGEHGERQ